MGFSMTIGETDMEEKIIEKTKEAAVDGKLSCVNAHAIAAELGLPPLEIGKFVNRATDLRFYRCQLGLFGYGPKPEGKHKIVQEAPRVPVEIEKALMAHTRDDHISCRAVWDIADQFEYPRLGMANIVEALDLKVTPCQLGCF
jgi:hypothetical protein